jgi:hypothetical protein
MTTQEIRSVQSGLDLPTIIAAFDARVGNSANGTDKRGQRSKGQGTTSEILSETIPMSHMESAVRQ